MTGTNATIAEKLRSYASVLSLEGANRFKLKAYRRAAETIEGLEEDVADLVKKGHDLTTLPGIGSAINASIIEIVQEGTLQRLERTLTRLSPEVVELASKPALDAKKIARIYKKLGIHSLAELKKNLDEGTIGKSLGARLEYHVRQGLDERPRSLLYDVEAVAEKIVDYIGRLKGVTRVAVAGSLRRRVETVGDLNFLVTGATAALIFRRFAKYGAVLSAEPRSPTECVYKLSSGQQITLSWTPASNWGMALLRATGSGAHLADLEARAARKKLKLGAAMEEKNVYAALDLAFIEPELREGRGEVAAAAQGKLPKLIEACNIRGDLHMHTTASDGANSIAEMAAAGQARGYGYIAITDHSQSLKITNGLSPERLRQHIQEIDDLNARLKGFRVLKSAEVDIMEDGKLDYPNSLLKELDLTICSIHSRFALDKARQTERIMRAMDNRYFTILGHATGRLLLRRPGYDVDMKRIVEHARANGCFFEINSSPDRLDLSDEHARLAKECGIKIAINTDAHAIRELDFIAAGINQARRAWLEAADVLNTQPLAVLLRLFRR